MGAEGASHAAVGAEGGSQAPTLVVLGEVRAERSRFS